MSTNRCLGTATWLSVGRRHSAVAHDLAPILMSFSVLVSDQSLIGFASQRAQEVAEIIGERMKLEPHGVGGERAVDSRVHRIAHSLLSTPAGPALVVEGDDILGGASHVGDNEANAWVKLRLDAIDLRLRGAASSSFSLGR